LTIYQCLLSPGATADLHYPTLSKFFTATVIGRAPIDLGGNPDNFDQAQWILAKASPYISNNVLAIYTTKFDQVFIRLLSAKNTVNISPGKGYPGVNLGSGLKEILIKPKIFTNLTISISDPSGIEEPIIIKTQSVGGPGNGFSQILSMIRIS